MVHPKDLTRGDNGPTLSKMTATPLALLQHLNGLTVEAVFWLKDLVPHLQDAAVTRQRREVSTVYSRSRTSCILTGHPIVLPPDLLRKGRFDEIFFVDLPDDGEREAIWNIHLGLRKQDNRQFDLIKIVSASDGFSGSEIEQAVVTALYRALHQRTPLTTGLLIEELTHTVPLSMTRREDIDQLRETAQGRFVNVR